MKAERAIIKNAPDIGVRLQSEKDEESKIQLIFLSLIANLKVDVGKACEISAVAASMGYLWIRQWSQEGYEGIKGKENKGGRPLKLSVEALEKLKDLLKEKECWTTKEVRGLIKESNTIWNYAVNYYSIFHIYDPASSKYLWATAKTFVFSSSEI